MSGALASQLRLLRDAMARSTPPDAVTAGTAATLFGELIADAEEAPADGTVADELARLRRLETRAGAEKAPAAQGAAERGPDTAALAAFLSEVNGAPVTVKRVDTVSRGMSKKTVLVTIEGAAALPPELALRVDRSANNYLGTTVIDEYRPLELLWQHRAPIPQPFALEPTGQVIGDPFIVSAAVGGAPVGSIYVPPTGRAELVDDVARCMARVHAVPTDRWPRPDQPQGNAFFDAQYAEHLADWQALGERSAIMDACFAWIDQHRDCASGPACVTHDDFNFNNMLVVGERVSAVLDWEFAHVGTPAADLAYFWYAAEANSSFVAFLDAYRAAGGTVPSTDQLAFYRMWGQLRLGVMGFKAVRNLEDGLFDDVRYSLSRRHRRQALFRLAALLDEAEAA